jgi:hypothetical protein
VCVCLSAISTSPPALLDTDPCHFPSCEGLPGDKSLSLPQPSPQAFVGPCPLRDTFLPSHRVGRATEPPPRLLG